jgi:2-alkyl-3-oxoalkanoate reductase
MKVLVAGATGGIGQSLVPQLIAAGHEVTGMIRSESSAAALRAQGANVVLADGLDGAAVKEAVASVRPEVVVHQMTALRGSIDFKKFDESFAVTNRLRTEGTDHLLAASQAAGVRRFVVQSYAGWNIKPGPSPLATEADGLNPNPLPATRKSLAAMEHLESVVTNADGIEGVVLRYASFYGPTADLGKGGSIVELIKKRRMPIIGDGSGVWSFIHYDDAAAVTVKAIESSATGIYNIADDDPAPISVWLPELANILGAKRPFKIPAWLGKLAVGDVGVAAFTTWRGVDNSLAKQTFNWQPGYASWREGFRKGL